MTYHSRCQFATLLPLMKLKQLTITCSNNSLYSMGDKVKNMECKLYEEDLEGERAEESHHWRY